MPFGISFLGLGNDLRKCMEYNDANDGVQGTNIPRSMSNGLGAKKVGVGITVDDKACTRA